MSKKMILQDVEACLGITGTSHETVSYEFGHRWHKMIKAHTAFLDAVNAYAASDGAKLKWDRVVEAATKLRSTIERFTQTPPIGNETKLIQTWMEKYLIPFNTTWNAITEKLEKGGVELNLPVDL